MPAPSGVDARVRCVRRVCASRARQRRSRAARMLEFAQHLDDVVAEIEATVRSRGLSAKFESERAARLRDNAAEELGELPL
jgi:hypothetical protein